MAPRLRKFALGSMACLLAACEGAGNPAPSVETVHDLIADLDVAEVHREPGLVDLGTPEARTLLRDGWSLDRTEGDRTFVSNSRPESEIEFFLVRRRDIPLTLRGTPSSGPGAAARETVTLILNGEPVGRVTVAAGSEEARMVLPERHLRAGRNHLVLRHAASRPDAVAWDSLHFATGVDERSRVLAAGDRLALPFGWRIDSYLPLPAGAVLKLHDLRSRGSAPGELRVTLRPEGGVEREVGRLRPGGGRSVALAGGDGRPVRISLSAVPEKPGGPVGSGLVLGRPVIAVSPDKARSAGALRASDRASSRKGTRPRNVILYLVDTLRADHLGCYGYGRPVSPRIDAFARQGVLFRHTVAHSSWTRPTTATLLTGLLPRTHGVYGHRDALAQEAVTLAESLRERGYRTAGIITNPQVARNFGLDQGFETYNMLYRKGRAATDVNVAAAEWLKSVEGSGAPFFLYLHTMEPHAPYAPPPVFRKRFAPGVEDERLTRLQFVEQLERNQVPVTPELRRDLIDLYDAEIAANDAAFGALLDLLAQRALLEETVIVFVSDHGEEFFDHGSWQHGKTLYTEMLDIPLIVRAPGMAAGKVVKRQAQQVDLVPTVLDLLGLSVPDALEGRSLVPWMTGEGEPATDPAEEVAFSWLEERGLQSAAVTTPEWRLISRRFPMSRNLLFNRLSDPGELHDLASEKPVRTGYLRTRLQAAERLKQGTLHADKAVMNESLRQQLRALGYLP